MLSKSLLISVVALATAGLPSGDTRADDTLPNLAGTYRCEPQPVPNPPDLDVAGVAPTTVALVHGPLIPRDHTFRSEGD